MSFFTFNFDADTMKAAEERLKGSAAPEQSTGPKVFTGPDGAVIIEDASYTKVTDVSEGSWTLAELNRVARFVGNIVNADGTFGAWIPLGQLKHYQDLLNNPPPGVEPASGESSTTEPKTDPDASQ